MTRMASLPLHGQPSAVTDWLKQRTGRSWVGDVAWSAYLTEQGCPPGRDNVLARLREGAATSWLGGPALAPLPEWPRTPDGTPMAKVVTLSLAHLRLEAAESDPPRTPDGAPDSWENPVHLLPSSGYLELFHDVRTWGWEEGDEVSWVLRYVPEPETLEPVDPPADLDTPSETCQEVIPLHGWTVPAGPETDSEDVVDALRRGWMVQRGLPAARSTDWVTPTSHVLGHGVADRDAAQDALANLLPLEHEDDRWILLLDLESWTHFGDWWGDAPQVEVWLRRSDLRAHRFDRARLLVRAG